MTNPSFVERLACPICSSENFEELFSSSFLEPPISDYLSTFYGPQGGIELDYLQDANYILQECLRCGLIYQRDVLNDNMMYKLYEEWIDPEIVLNSIERNRNRNYYIRISREIETIIRHFQRNPSTLQLLDFGMGWGVWSRIANAYGCNTFGFEISPTRIEYAKERGTPILTWADISLHKYDFINAEQVFEHIPEPFETFVHLSNSLTDHGVIKIGVPNGWGIKRKLICADWNAPKGSKKSLNPVAPLEHINCFTASTLIEMAQEAGFEPLKLPAISDSLIHILDITMRDILRSLYRIYFRFTHIGYMSTNLFFKRRNGT